MANDDELHDPCQAESLELETELAIGALDEGGEQALEQFLAARPHLAPEIRRRLDRLRAAGLLDAVTEPPEKPCFGEFAIVREIAAGGMGVVYLAEQTSLRRKVALKVVRPELIGSETARARFQREVGAVARLSHPGIVPILAVDLEGAVPWFAMEFVPGVTLDEVIRSVRERGIRNTTGASIKQLVAASNNTTLFDGSYQEFAVRLALQVAQALSYVHAHGIVHRDVKPSNIMLTAHGQAMLLDFGLAQVATDQRLTRSQAAVGSPAYMSPEQVRGEALDERVDVYGLGVTLYELLTTKLPFDGTTPEDVYSLIVNGTFQPLDRVNREVTHDLSVAVGAAMDLDRNRRYGSMADFAEDLERILHHKPIRARPLPHPLRVFRWCQRRPAAATALAAFLFVLLQLPLLLWWFQAEANSQLQQHNRALEASRQKEAAARELASASFEDAFVAIHDLLERTATRDLVPEPGSERLRITLLERALTLYQRLLWRRPEEVRLVIEECRTRRALSALQLQVGNYSEAEQQFGEVVARLAGVDDPEAPAISGITHKLWSLALLYQGNLDDALSMAREGLCELEQADRLTPSLTYRIQAAELLSTQATIHEQHGDKERWYRLMLEALARKRAVLAEAPRRFDAAKSFAIGCSNAARALSWRRQHRKALQHVDEGIAALQQIHPDEPDLVTFQHVLAEIYDRRGQILNETGRQEEAEEAYGQALALCFALCQEHPDVDRYLSQAGQTLHNLAMTYYARRDYESSLGYDQEAIRYLGRARIQAPSRRSYRRFLEYAHVGRCAALLSLRRLGELGAACRELGEEAVTTQGILNAARITIRHAQLVTTVDEATSLREAAARLVERAIDAGFRSRSHFTNGRFAKLYSDLVGNPVYDAALGRL